MGEGLYQKLLGIPAEAVAPDYYQLLDVERGLVDVNRIDDNFQQRTNLLDSVDPVYKDVADYMKKELEEARATLMDPQRRNAYDEFVRRKRFEDLRRCVERLLESGRLSEAATRALTGRMIASGMDEQDIAQGLQEGVEKLGAERETGGTPSPEEVAEWEERVAALLKQMADAQLAGHLALAGIAPPITTVMQIPPDIRAQAMAAPPPQERAGTRRQAAPVAAPAAVIRKETTRRRDMPTRRETSRRPTAPIPAPADPPAEEVTVESAGGADEAVTKLNARLNALERERSSLQQQVGLREPERRSARRRSRALLSAFLIAAAYIAGYALSALLPESRGWVDPVNQKIAKFVQDGGWADKAAYIGGGAALVLYLIVLWTAGARGKLPFLIASLPLLLAALVGGTVPFGQVRSDLEKVGTLEAQIKTVTEERDRLKAQADGKVVELERQLAARQELLSTLEKKQEQMGRQVAAMEAELQKVTAERDDLRKSAEELGTVRQKLAEKEAESKALSEQLTTLRAELAAADRQIRQLKKENEELRRKK